MDDEIELSGCPFCGARVCLEEFHGLFWIMCPRCSITTTFYDTKEQAINIWETRYNNE